MYSAEHIDKAFCLITDQSPKRFALRQVEESAGKRFGGVRTVNSTCQPHPLWLTPSGQYVVRPAKVAQERIKSVGP
jgi:hypothetical protein